MTDSEFSQAMALALRVCREAAAAGLPIETMLTRVEDGIEAAMSSGLSSYGSAAEMLSMPPDAVAELEALREIIGAVGEVAAIGSKLPPEPAPTAVPTTTGSFPVPANLGA